MLLLARIGAWIFAVFFGVAPIVFSIAKDPALISNLLSIKSYTGMTKDLILCAIAIQAIGFVDATETTISSLDKGRESKNIAGAAILIIMALVIHISLCINWISGEANHLEDIKSIPIWIYSSIIMSFSARLLLIAGDSQ